MKRALPPRSRGHLPQPRLVRRVPAARVRALPGLAARARARAGGVHRPPRFPSCSPRLAPRSPRTSARAADDLDLRPERHHRREHGRALARPAPGDEILATDARIRRPDVLLATGVCERTVRATSRVARRPAHADVDDLFARRHRAHARRLRLPRHVADRASLPVEDIVRPRARRRGSPSIVDGAHAPGHRSRSTSTRSAPTSTPATATSGCARRRAPASCTCVPSGRSASTAPIVSWGYLEPATFLSRTERQGTHDDAAYLTVPDAIAFQRDHDWDTVRTRCRRTHASRRGTSSARCSAPSRSRPRGWCCRWRAGPPAAVRRRRARAPSVRRAPDRDSGDEAGAGTCCGSPSPATRRGRTSTGFSRRWHEPLRGAAGARGRVARRLLLVLGFASRYGWQRDELYLAVAGRHPAAGYIDFPPITPLLAGSSTRSPATHWSRFASCRCSLAASPSCSPR